MIKAIIINEFYNSREAISVKDGFILCGKEKLIRNGEKKLQKTRTLSGDKIIIYGKAIAQLQLAKAQQGAMEAVRPSFCP